MKLLLDMDGVTTDFIAGIGKHLGKPYPYNDPANLGQYDLTKHWNITSDELLAPTNTPRFWEQLHPMHDLPAILELILKYFKPEDICVLSKPPTISPYAMVGKWNWCIEHLPIIPNRLFGNIKGFCAHREAVLLDDDDFKIDRFRMDGGRAVLMPRPWNSMFDQSGDLRCVEAAFEAMFIPKVCNYS